MYDAINVRNYLNLLSLNFSQAEAQVSQEFILPSYFLFSKLSIETLPQRKMSASRRLTYS